MTGNNPPLRNEERTPIRVIAFLCNWCSFAAADQAGLKRLPVPPEVLVVRVACSGRVEPTLVLEAFQQGASGVLLLGCHPGDCHYHRGNLQAQCRAILLEGMLPQIGIPSARFRFHYLASTEADIFSTLCESFVRSLYALDKSA